MGLILVIIVLVLLLGGGGGYYGHTNYGGYYGPGFGIGGILLVLLILYLVGVLR